MRNGKGKEYYFNGKLKFEGEYLNGERNGFGKEYNPSGKIEFEGKYLKNKRWEGKGFDPWNNIEYELKGGKGMIHYYYYSSNKLYIEQCLNGELNGEVKIFQYNKIIFEGKFLNGIKMGKGKEYEQRTGNLEFEGEYYYGYRIKGKTYVDGKLELEGEFLFDEEWNGVGYDPLGN